MVFLNKRVGMVARRRREAITRADHAEYINTNHTNPTHMKTTSLLTIVATLSFSLAACVKEGPIGPQGAQGEQGEGGQDGDDGSANVTTVTAPPFEQYPFAPNYQLSTEVNYILNTALITQDIIDNGVVLGYVNTSGGWTALNFAVPISGELLQYRGYIEPGQYRVNMKFSDGGVISPGDPLDSMNPLTVKVIIIEGGRMMTEDQIRKLAQTELAR